MMSPVLREFPPRVKEGGMQTVPHRSATVGRAMCRCCAVAVVLLCGGCTERNEVDGKTIYACSLAIVHGVTYGAVALLVVGAALFPLRHSRPKLVGLGVTGAIIGTAVLIFFVPMLHNYVVVGDDEFTSVRRFLFFKTVTTVRYDDLADIQVVTQTSRRGGRSQLIRYKLKSGYGYDEPGTMIAAAAADIYARAYKRSDEGRKTTLAEGRKSLDAARRGTPFVFAVPLSQAFSPDHEPLIPEFQAALIDERPTRIPALISAVALAKIRPAALVETAAAHPDVGISALAALLLVPNSKSEPSLVTGLKQGDDGPTLLAAVEKKAIAPGSWTGVVHGRKQTLELLPDQKAAWKIDDRPIWEGDYSFTGGKLRFTQHQVWCQVGVAADGASIVWDLAYGNDMLGTIVPLVR
jgi:hypothetical protein